MAELLDLTCVFFDATDESDHARDSCCLSLKWPAFEDDAARWAEVRDQHLHAFTLLADEARSLVEESGEDDSWFIGRLLLFSAHHAVELTFRAALPDHHDAWPKGPGGHRLRRLLALEREVCGPRQASSAWGGRHGRPSGHGVDGGPLPVRPEGAPLADDLCCVSAQGLLEAITTLTVLVQERAQRLANLLRPASDERDDVAMPYLTPEVPRWVPDDEAAIAAAAQAGLLVESHYLDLKEAIPGGSGKNRELARDLASFAIDGGALLVGVAERNDRPPELAPVELAGLAERVEQVARQIPDPPIPVTCTPIPASTQPGHGYLLIEIPATGTAPHMVDGVYMGRGDKTKTRLSDPEVLRLHQARAHTHDQIAQLLDEYVARDPIAAYDSHQAHAFVVAAPVRPRPEMLLDARPNGSWQQLLHQLLDQGAHTPYTILSTAGTYDPNLRSVSEFSRRADGAALTYNLTPTREPNQWHADRPPSEDVVELEVAAPSAS